MTLYGRTVQFFPSICVHFDCDRCDCASRCSVICAARRIQTLRIPGTDNRLWCNYHWFRVGDASECDISSSPPRSRCPFARLPLLPLLPLPPSPLVLAAAFPPPSRPPPPPKPPPHLSFPPQARDGYVRRGSRSKSGQRSVVATDISACSEPWGRVVRRGWSGRGDRRRRGRRRCRKARCVLDDVVYLNHGCCGCPRGCRHLPSPP